MTDIAFEAFPKIARLSRVCVITEKIDGTNAQINISDDLKIIQAGSRNQWLGEHADNYGFHAWVMKNKDELLKLGPGRHFGEWWGCGIQRKYNMTEKVFSLFNAFRWKDDAVRPACCRVVPTLGFCNLDDAVRMQQIIQDLKANGSAASPGFMQPEGIVIYHAASKQLFKKTLEHDEEPKGMKGTA